MGYLNPSITPYTEFDGFKLHVVNMCQLLVKSHPEYSEELKNLLESQIIEYRIETIMNSISGCIETKSYILFNDAIKELIIRASKDIHDIIMTDNFILQCIESGFNIDNYSFNILVYGYKQYTKTISIKSAHYLENAIPILTITDPGTSLFDNKIITVEFNAAVHTGAKIDNLARKLSKKFNIK